MFSVYEGSLIIYTVLRFFCFATDIIIIILWFLCYRLHEVIQQPDLTNSQILCLIKLLSFVL